MTLFTPRHWLNQPWVIWLAIVTHLVFGVMILKDPRVTMIGVLAGLNTFNEVNPKAIACVLIGASVVATCGLVFERLLTKRQSLALLFPQYFMLMIAFFSDLSVLWTSKINDRPIDRDILMAAILPFMCMIVMHNLNIYYRYTHWTGKK